MIEAEQTAKQKLDPRRFDTSPKMHALLGWLVGDSEAVDPAIAEFTVTSDGYVLARHEGDFGFNGFFSGVEDFRHNLNGIMDVAELTHDEREWVISRLNTISGYEHA